MDIKTESKKLIEEFLTKVSLKKGDILVLGCSTSEVIGSKIGSNSNLKVAQDIFAGIYPILKKHGIYLAVQCCEHLNRAIVIEKEAAKDIDIVNVVPQPKAGGSMATTAYQNFNDPVVVEKIKANAGIDIGSTLIGMHLKEVAVPVRLSTNKLGEAYVICARTRPKFIGGIRAIYNENLL